MNQRPSNVGMTILKRDSLGIVEWFRPGEYQRVEYVLEKLNDIGIKHIRTGFSWADWYSENGMQWFEWLLPKIAENFELLPCFTYTPPSIGLEPKTSSPPRTPKDYADFIDVMITRFGHHFEYIELWNEPNNLKDWDWRMDQDWNIFCDMIGKAAFWAQKRGKKTVLGGMSPTDTNWLDLMCMRNVINHIDAVGIHGFPGTWDFNWTGWRDHVTKVRNVLEKHALTPDIWITEAGFSTWSYDDYQQVVELVDVLNAPVGRCYWYSAQDLDSDIEHTEGFHKDERHYHFGLFHSDGSDKLIYRIWKQNGLQGLSNISKYNGLISPYVHRNARAKEEKYTLITGGAGFIGTNVAERLLSSGQNVIIYDNLSRRGVEKNMHWLREVHGSKVKFKIADTRNRYALRQIMPSVDKIFHFAAQVAVTTSLENPMDDFGVNLQGTLNLLEEIRLSKTKPLLLFTSTNKVYGSLSDLKLHESVTRYEPQNRDVVNNGISELRPLDFHSPYGCSKGSADQYVLDYCRIFDLPAVVFRMSCIYGLHQCGNEDQGWVAHFLLKALKDEKITIFGDGKQVRDILFIDDLVNAMMLAMSSMSHLKGMAFNIGGGVQNTVSLCELIDLIENLTGKKVITDYESFRLGDQKYYVSNINLFNQMTGWTPKTNVQDGVTRLYEWLSKELELEKYEESYV